MVSQHLNLLMTSSSQETLLSIPIQDCSTSEMRMKIDSPRNCCATFTIFSIVVLILGIIGSLGPPAVITRMSPLQDISPPSTESPDHDEWSIASQHYSISDLSAFNRFLRISFFLLRPNTQQSLTTTIQYRYHLYFRMPDGHIFESQSESNQSAPVILHSRQSSTPRLVTLSDVIIKYTSVNLTINLIHVDKDFTQSRIVANFGSIEHTYFQIVFRLLFSIISLLLTAKFVCQFRSMPSSWRFEQKLTFPLLVLVFIYNNPFYPINAQAPTRAYIIFDTIGHNFFNAYFRFFILALFDSLRFKNRQADVCFFVPKIGIVLALFISSLVHGLYDDMSDFGMPRVSVDHIEENLRGAETAVFVLYACWAAGSIVFARVHVDAMEIYKFNLYVAAGGASLGTIAVVYILLHEYVWLRTS
jgi:hypothetical protein